jgi:hypothetical protein
MIGFYWMIIEKKKRYLRSLQVYFLGAVALSISFLYGLDWSFFQINDDVLIASIADGTFYGTSSSQVMYPSILIGELLVFLYGLNMSINWYFILIVFTQVATIVFFTVFISKNLESKIELFLMLFLIFISYIIFISLQYTQTAIFTAGVASFILLNSQKRKERYLATILLIVGLLWRFEAGILGAGIVFAIVLLFGYRNLLSKPSFVFIFAIFLGVIVHILSLNLIFFNSDIKNKEFYEFNSARESVQGFEPVQSIDKTLYPVTKKVGWSKNDYALSQRKSYASDQEIFSKEVYEYVSERRYEDISFSFVISLGQNFASILLNNYLSFLGILFFFPLLVYWLSNDLKIQKVIVFWIFMFTIYLIVLLMGKLPDRIFWPATIVGLLSFFSLIVLKQERLEKSVSSRSHWGTALFSALLFFGVLNIISYANLINEAKWWKSVGANNAQGFNRILDFKSDRPIVAFSSFYSPLYQTASPADGPTKLPQIRKDLVVVGWVNRSPDYEANLERLGLSQDLFTSIAEGDAYLAVGDIEDLQMVDQFLREHRNIAVKWPQAPFVFNDTGLGIWKVESFSYLN